MTLSSRAKAKIADQGSRTLSADAALLSTRQAEAVELRWREKAYIRAIDERIHNYAEVMRRMRMFLAPSFGSEVGLLY